LEKKVDMGVGGGYGFLPHWVFTWGGVGSFCTRGEGEFIWRCKESPFGSLWFPWRGRPIRGNLLLPYGLGKRCSNKEPRNYLALILDRWQRRWLLWVRRGMEERGVGVSLGLLGLLGPIGYPW